MDLIKILLFIVILFGLTFVGYMFSKKYKEKLQFFKDINVFCNILEQQIKFTKNSISSIVKNHEESFGAQVRKLLNCVLVEKKQYENQTNLNERENNFIKNFLLSLGKFNASGEVGNINGHKSEINRLIEQSAEENEKYGTMGTKLGFIMGLLVCIVLI